VCCGVFAVHVTICDVVSVAAFAAACVADVLNSFRTLLGVLQCALQYVLQCALQYALQCALQCVLWCVLQMS